jgi:hypothetical protein
MMKNASIHEVAIARKPRTTITAIAQCGKPEDVAPDCTLLVLVLVDAPPAALAECAEADEADAAEAEVIEAITESA